ncbi:MAG: hypothetical protein RLO81_14035, partial [Fulvivirga sp.]|uniref:hypothetical protein n=1 Tax=Fulvivirga sp. TaxID=1931237 RepID=UPI0032ECCCE3
RNYSLKNIAESDYEVLWELMAQDKKNNDSKVLAVLLKTIGEATFDCEVSKKETFEALTYLNQV